MASILNKLLGSLAAKRVLVINFDYEYEGVSYHGVLKRQLSCTFCKWDDLSFVNGVLVADGKPLSEYSFVVLGVVGEHSVTYGAALECVKAAGVPFISYGSSVELNNKLRQLVCFKESGVSHPLTVIQAADPAKAKSLIEELKLPLITKPLDGSQGKGILKHETVEALVKELQANKGKLLITQEALTAKCDYRVYMLGDELMLVLKRSSTKKGEFRHNISLGASVERNVKLPPEAVALAKAAQKAVGFDISGVDLLQDEGSGVWYVLEVNAAPQFEAIALIIGKLAELIKSRI